MKNKNRDFDWDKIVHLSLTFGICIFSLSIIFALWANLMRGIWNQIEENNIKTIKLLDSYAVVTSMNWENPKNEIEVLLRDGFKNDNNLYYYLSDNERYIVESIVAGEAGHEPLLGKMAVAQCVLNACKQDGIQPSEVKIKYQYSGWKDIDKFEINYPEMAEEVKHSVWCVFDNGEIVTQDNILWFYAPKYSNGSFHNTQKFSLEIGGHRFYSPI